MRGLAAFLVNARQGGHAVLRHTKFIVRTAGTAELCGIHNAGADDTLRSGVIQALERHCLRHADLLWTQSAETIAAYQRHYGADALAPHTVLPTPEVSSPVVPRTPRRPDEPLRFDWGHSYGPITWSRDGAEVLRVATRRARVPLRTTSPTQKVQDRATGSPR